MQEGQQFAYMFFGIKCIHVFLGKLLNIEHIKIGSRLKQKTQIIQQSIAHSQSNMNMNIQGSPEHQKELLQREIKDNDYEIKSLTSKIIKSDFDKRELEKLRRKQLQLLEKQRENQQFIRNRQQLKQLEQEAQWRDKLIKEELNKQYQNAIEQKRRQSLIQQQKEKQQEKLLIQVQNEKAIQQAIRQKEFVENFKQEAQMDQQFWEKIKNHKKLEEEQQKELVKQRQESQLLMQNPKQQQYKDYYQNIGAIQGKIEENYLSQVAPQNLHKELTKQELINRGVLEVQRRTDQMQSERYSRSIEAKRDLREFLKNQMELNEKKKEQQKIQEYRQGLQQLNSIKYAEELQKKRLREIKQQGIKLAQQRQSPLTERRRSQPFLPSETKHNPITNPIGFKIGITNPYIIKEYEHAKQEYLGQKNLKLNNLALLGSSSLHRS